MSPTKDQNQFALLFSKRFSGFFWTQFFTAFNDNVYKNAVIIYISFYAVDWITVNPNMLINLGAGLFILPFFLFSAFSGQLSDKYEKAYLIRRIKVAEIVIMSFVSIGFFMDNLLVLFILLFMMGTQSTFFSPIKYSIIPQYLSEKELIGGNALVEMGTFVAILAGTITGGILIQLYCGKIALSIAVFLFAVIGWLTSLRIPEAPSAVPSLELEWNPFSQTMKIIGFAKKDPVIWRCVWAISWFWFLGGAYLTQIPNFSKICLMGDETVATFCLSIFSLGIGIGSMMCEKLSKQVNLRLSAIGAVGLCIFGTDIPFAYTPVAIEPLTLSQFFQTNGSYRITTDFLLFSIFGGFYIVPLYAFIQKNTPFECRSRIISANNIINAFLMVLSAITGMIVLGVMGLSIPVFFLLLSVFSAIFFLASFIFVEK
jgi:MFS family permease